MLHSNNPYLKHFAKIRFRCQFYSIFLPSKVLPTYLVIVEFFTTQRANTDSWLGKLEKIDLAKIQRSILVHRQEVDASVSILDDRLQNARGRESLISSI